MRRRLTFANIVSVLALVVALAGTGGAAYALGKNTVGSPQIKNGQVKTKDLGKTSVATKKIKKNAVTGAKVKNGSLSGGDLAPKAAGTVSAALTTYADGTIDSWFNRSGGKPTVDHFAQGRYAITFPGIAPAGLSEAKPAGIVLITPVENDLRTCAWGSGAGAAFVISCTYDNAYINTSFSVAVLKD